MAGPGESTFAGVGMAAGARGRGHSAQDETRRRTAVERNKAQRERVAGGSMAILWPQLLRAKNLVHEGFVHRSGFLEPRHHVPWHVVALLRCLALRTA
jgi:hypothetical protein